MQTLSSFRPGEIWPDSNGVHINAHGGGILFHKGVYYWFGEHKIAGGAGNSAMVGVSCYSSADLYNWRDEGVVMTVSDDPVSEIVRGCVIERPKVIYNALTGKFVMWFHLELSGHRYRAARSGIAVSDMPAGPYRYVGSMRPNAGYWPLNVPEQARCPLNDEEKVTMAGFAFPGGERPDYPDNIFRRDFVGGQMARDMTLFVDDDGAAYHIYSSEENGTTHISRLSDDYQSCSGQYVRIFPGRFNEAPAIFKRDGKYYLITSGCTGWTPNAARLSMANSIWGPWREIGNPCVGTPEQIAVTFDSQSTYVLPVDGKYIFMADRWMPKNPIDGRYIWLPVQFNGDVPFIEWQDDWRI